VDGAESTAALAPARWREVFEGQRGRLTSGLLLLEALVAVEVLIVVTVLPAVERDLGGLRFYGWAFGAFGLATIASVPIGGRATDRYGPRWVLIVSLALYVAGLVIAALSPAMLILVFGRFVQGFGGGGLYVMSLGTIAKTYPQRVRPRVMALLASMWILPGLFGPPLGALLASTVGWRWAFIAPLPLLVIAAALVLPPLGSVRIDPNVDVRLSLRWPAMLMVGTAIFLGGLTPPGPWTALLLPLGAAIGLPALARIAPPGAFRARPGLAAAAVAAFLVSCSFAAIDGFVPLMLTQVRGLSIGVAGIALTVATFFWAGGSWWQSRSFGAWSASKLSILGGAIVALGVILLMLGLTDLPIVLPYIGYALGGLGMGIVFPTVPLSAMSVTSEGREANELSSALLMDYLGIAIGAGLAGASVALSDAELVSLEVGIGGAFAIGLLSAIGVMLVARRLPSGRPAGDP
jgi:MFS family permease